MKVAAVAVVIAGDGLKAASLDMRVHGRQTIPRAKQWAQWAVICLAAKRRMASKAKSHVKDGKEWLKYNMGEQMFIYNDLAAQCATREAQLIRRPNARQDVEARTMLELAGAKEDQAQ